MSSAYAYNPSFSRGRDWEDHHLRPAWAKSSQDPVLTNKNLGVVVCSLSQLHKRHEQVDRGPGLHRHKHNTLF
jgi:hypothetical protein